ncbi:hypothetical protein F3164_09785 [Streptococcus agalactiae]|nr:hypothetical protein SAM_0200 [Streptococcus agalactiae CJB111]KAA8958395.1 hypothetical protein F3146_09695 [Streptococcus agalactiae]KAA8965045.1 hypothetical protein F3148_10085 [Streptococcus agalactiae]KAA8978155.1 hypothetical protein F3159_09860 [Streptococcus agalactiae]KAA8987530.1 hypothetical protein F3164_09785 [Streptococcus agalactiae]
MVDKRNVSDKLVKANPGTTNSLNPAFCHATSVTTMLDKIKTIPFQARITTTPLFLVRIKYHKILIQNLKISENNKKATPMLPFCYDL